jgi:hypothetical protein
MSTTTYRHANTPVLTGRERNIADALQRVKSGVNAMVASAFPTGPGNKVASAARPRKKRKKARKRR